MEGEGGEHDAGAGWGEPGARHRCLVEEPLPRATPLAAATCPPPPSPQATPPPALPCRRLDAGVDGMALAFPFQHRTCLHVCPTNIGLVIFFLLTAPKRPTQKRDNSGGGRGGTTARAAAVAPNDPATAATTAAAAVAAVGTAAMSAAAAAAVAAVAGGDTVPAATASSYVPPSPPPPPSTPGGKRPAKWGDRGGKALAQGGVPADDSGKSNAHVRSTTQLFTSAQS